MSLTLYRKGTLINWTLFILPNLGTSHKLIVQTYLPEEFLVHSAKFKISPVWELLFELKV